MSVKTCQLCGKPLSRLRVGADPEFCSKEHRNQFKMRKGMDRLVEVNKVANLMRRRESPKHIAFSNLMAQSAITPRGFYESERTSVHTTPFSRKAEYEAFAEPRITAHADDCLLLRGRRYAGQKLIRRPNSNRVRIQGRNANLSLPDGRWKLKANVAQAPARSLHHRSAANPQRREFKLLRPPGIRVHVGNGPAALRRTPFPGTEALRQGLRPPSVRFVAAKGNALRVSISRGFTLARASVRAFQTKPDARSALVYARRAMTIVPDILNQQAGARALAAATTSIAMRIPGAPQLSQNAQFHARGAMTPPGGSAMRGTLPSARFSPVGWTLAQAQWKPGPITPDSAGFARRNGVHLKRLAMLPNRVTSVPQTTFSPFIPQEPRGCPVVQFQAVIAGGAPAPAPTPAVTKLPDLPEAPALKPVAKKKAVAVHFEEHFEAGWDNWVGDVEDWKMDVAGVRTGAMALFMPTLDLTDYELEFLARIDTKTLNWVVRATGLEDHVRCTLTAVADNQVEFSRTVVKGGVAESTVVSATRVAGKKRASLTVKTNVSDNSFVVSVNGETIDSWTESRLPSGGVGFTGAAEDRARLYWVKVSSTQDG